MKDLYKLIGLTPTALTDEIAAAIRRLPDEQHRKVATNILLTEHRRRVYDRSYRTLKQVGRLRANLNLQQGRHWSSAYTDFNVPPRSHGPILKPEQEQSPDRQPLPKRKGSRAAGIFVALSFLLFIAVVSRQESGSNHYARETGTSSHPAPTANVPVPLKEEAVGLGDNPEEAAHEAPPLPDPLPLPANGRYVLSEGMDGVAPFEVVTRYGGPHYLVKLVDAVTKEPVLVMFVHSGERATAQVPLGTYELRYATGDNWYGNEYDPKKPFGPDTRFSKSDDLFVFSDEGYQISGYTVELYLQADGNLETEAISAEEF